MTNQEAVILKKNIASSVKDVYYKRLRMIIILILFSLLQMTPFLVETLPFIVLMAPLLKHLGQVKATVHCIVRGVSIIYLLKFCLKSSFSPVVLY